MKSEFSTAWKSSKQTRKQRKYRYNAPLHLKYKFMSANLSKELRAKLGKRNTELRKNDTVKVMRGQFAGKTGKVLIINLKRTRISVEGLQRQKKDGTKINVWFNPSKVQIKELGEDRKKKEVVKTETKAEKKEVAEEKVETKKEAKSEKTETKEKK